MIWGKPGNTPEDWPQLTVAGWAVLIVCCFLLMLAVVWAAGTVQTWGWR